MRAALYARVSTEEQAKEGFSIDAQLNILSAWTIVKGYTIYNRYVDEGYSAKNLNRPAVRKLLEDCEAGLVDAVIVWRLDRLSRSLHDMLDIVEDIFRPHSIEFVSTTESIDTTTTSGRLTLNILASVAQNEREVTAERVSMVAMDRAKQCFHMGGVPPYGYSVGADRHYIINESEAAAVRMAFEMRRDGYSYSEIITALTEHGFRTRKGNVFENNLLHDILRNEKYAGVYVYNRSAAATRDGTRNNHASKPDDQILRVEGGMPAIVDRSTFDAVQRILKTAARSGSALNNKRTYVCSGLVFCGICGRRMIVESVGRNRDGSYQFSYQCKNKCVKRIRHEALDAHVFSFIKSLVDDPSIVSTAVATANAAAAEEHSSLADDLAAIQSELSDIESKISSIVAFIATAGANAPASLANELTTLECRRDTLNHEAAAATQNAKNADADKIISGLASASELSTAAPEAQRATIRRVIQSIRIYDDVIWIDLIIAADSGNLGGGDSFPCLPMSTIRQLPATPRRLSAATVFPPQPPRSQPAAS